MKQDRRQKLIDNLLIAYAILGHTPSSVEIDELHKRGLVESPHSTYSSEFPTWEEAILAAGLEKRRYRTRSKTYTKEELIELLRNFIKEKGHIPTQVELNECKEMPSWFTYIGHFGNMKTAFALAGYDYDRGRNDLSKAEAIKILQDLSVRLGRAPIAKDLGQKNGTPCRKSFEKIFDCAWSDILKIAGLKRKPKKRRKKIKYDSKSLLKDYLRAAAKLGHYPTTEELGKKNGTHSYRIYVDVYGSWQNFQAIVEQNT